MNDTIVDKETYQKNRRMMCWIALALMSASTIATIAFPSRMAEADSIPDGTISIIERPCFCLFPFRQQE